MKPLLGVDLVEGNPGLQDKVIRASGFFSNMNKKILIDPLESLSVESDNRVVEVLLKDLADKISALP